jgi:hypothetical protein
MNAPAPRLATAYRPVKKTRPHLHGLGSNRLLGSTVTILLLRAGDVVPGGRTSARATSGSGFAPLPLADA